MKSYSSRFLLILVCLIVAMVVLTLLVENSIPAFVTPYWSLLILFFSIVSIVVYFMTMKIKAKNDFGKFTKFYMGTTVVKLLTYLGIILTYSIMFPDDKKSFIFTFLAYYLCFTIFETYILVKK